MNTYCPNCNNPIADASDQYCSACFEVRPPSGWPGQGAANAAPPASAPSMTPADDDSPTSRRRERPKTVIESDIDLQAFAAQVHQQAAESPPASTPQSAPPSFGSPPPFGGPPAGGQPPAYGGQPPAYGGEPPAYGGQPQQSPPPGSYGAQPSGNYGGPSPSSYGAQPPSGSYGGGGSPGYGAQPPGGGYSPPSGSGYGNAQPPRKSNTGLIIGIIVGVLLLFGACPCAGFFLFAARSSSDSTPIARSNGDDNNNNNNNFDDSDNADEDEKDDDPTPRRRTRRVRRRRSGPAPVSSLNQDVITRRLTSDGWEVLGTPSQQNGPGYSTLIISIIRTPAGGAVGLYHYDDTNTAISLEKNFRENPNAAVKREGQDVVSVIMPDRPELARETLDVVLGKKSH